MDRVITSYVSVDVVVAVRGLSAYLCHHQVGCLRHSQVCPSGQISTTSTMTMTSTPTHLPQPSVGAAPPGTDGTKVLDVGAVRDPGQLYPPGRDSVPAVTAIVLVDTVLIETVSLVTVE